MVAGEQAASRRKIWGWMMFDWASQPYHTLLLTFVFGPYFVVVVGDATEAQVLWGTTVAATGAAIAVLSPVLGALADSWGRRLPWIGVFSLAYVLGAAALWTAAPGSEHLFWILLAFGVGLVGAEFAATFTHAMLPDLAPRAQIGALSGNGWAWGYLGGFFALVIALGVLAEGETGKTLFGLAPPFGLDPEAREGTRAVGPFVALWYLVFMVPFALWVHEAPRAGRVPVAQGLRDLGATLRALPKERSFTAYLAASMFYRDALAGMYIFGGIYATGVLGWTVPDVGAFGILAVVAGAAAAWVGGRMDHRLGPKPVIRANILILLVVSVVVVSVSRDGVLGISVEPSSRLPDILFYICGAVIGAAGGALQASSRTMLVFQADPARMTEAFGLYALAGKATAFIAPTTIAFVTAATESQRAGITPLILLFAIGLALLLWVKPDGDRAK